MKYLKKACSLVSGVICFCMLVLGIGMILGYLLGFRFLAVTTGSMKEVYGVGTLVVADKVSPDEIETGDIISYVTDDALTVVTHRVIAVDSENRCFYTKGDSNNVADSRPVVFENLIGKVRFGIPALGYLVIFAKSKAGRIILRGIVILIVFFVIQQWIYHRMQKRRKKEKENRDEETAEKGKTE